MSAHSYSRCWLHLIWTTLDRAPILRKPAAVALSNYLTSYSGENGIYMKINYVNADHVHALIDLPTSLSLEKIAQLLKGSSSHWINEQKIVQGRFGWGRGYGAFSVSHSNVEGVGRYIAKQEEHHRSRTFMEEYETFVRRHGLKWYEAGKPVNGLIQSSSAIASPG